MNIFYDLSKSHIELYATRMRNKTITHFLYFCCFYLTKMALGHNYIMSYWWLLWTYKQFRPGLALTEFARILEITSNIWTLYGRFATDCETLNQWMPLYYHWKSEKYFLRWFYLVFSLSEFRLISLYCASGFLVKNPSNCVVPHTSHRTLLSI